MKRPPLIVLIASLALAQAAVAGAEGNLARAQPDVQAEGVSRAPGASGAYRFITLGTQGGPMPSPDRSEPANLLMREGSAYLVDAGDNAMTRAIAAGAQFPWLKGVFISHLHFDHIGGLFAILGLRHQTRTHAPFTIYGPPGTRQLITGLQAAMEPSARSGYGIPGEVYVAPDQNITVVELDDGAVVPLEDMTVTVAANSHYSFAPGSAEARRFRSLSYRFDMPDRSIVYTGDTGPSPEVERLAIGADLLVTEMIDLDATLASASVSARRANMDPEVVRQMVAHLSTHHLSTQQIGELATRAGVAQIVVTHLAGGASNGSTLQYVTEINRVFRGPVVIASDLDSF